MLSCFACYLPVATSPGPFIQSVRGWPGTLLCKRASLAMPWFSSSDMSIFRPFRVVQADSQISFNGLHFAHFRRLGVRNQLLFFLQAIVAFHQLPRFPSKVRVTVLLAWAQPGFLGSDDVIRCSACPISVSATTPRPTSVHLAYQVSANATLMPRPPVGRRRHLSV